MDDTTKRIIDDARDTVLDGGMINESTILKLLEIDPHSEECEYLGQASREIMKKFFGGRARIGSSIGVDIRPCSMNCRFCALGKKWGLIQGEHELPDEVIIDLVREVISKGYFQVTLRTTEFYPVQKLCALGRKVREAVPGDYFLVANTGELTPNDANELVRAGFTGSYHTVRLREGIDTPFDPEERIKSIKSVNSSLLNFTVGIEPIGSEHTNQEILDKIILFRELKPMSVCIMKRVNVKGVPLSEFPEIDDERMAQIVAVTRLAGGKTWGIATHPPTQKALDFGANHITVETGANPRDDIQTAKQWYPFDHAVAAEMIRRAGWDLGRPSDIKRKR